MTYKTYLAQQTFFENIVKSQLCLSDRFKQEVVLA